MDANDILRMMDLDGTCGPVRAGSDPLAGESTGGVVGAGNPNAFDLDEWDRRRGRDLSDAAGPGLSSDPTDWADVHHALFDPSPELLAGCLDRAKRRFLAEMMETSEFHALHTQTRLDTTRAGAAAEQVMAGLERFRAESKRDPKRSPLGPIGAALDAAEAAAEEAGEMERGLFPGDAFGDETGKSDPARTVAAYHRVRNSYRLRKIIDMAGRFRRVAQSRQRHKTDHGQDEIVGVSIGAEVSRLLPVELARLMCPELELDTLRRITEHEALVREYQSPEPVAQGPVVVLVDESSSMDKDEKFETAKGLALAMAYVARKQGRFIALVSFSGTDYWTHAVAERSVILPPNKWDETALLGWLENFFRGGTTADVLMDRVPDALWSEMMARGASRGKTDLVVLTDGQIAATQPQIDKFTAWKAAERVKLHTVMIQDRGGVLPGLSDELHEVSSLSPESDAAARVLSI